MSLKYIDLVLIFSAAEYRFEICLGKYVNRTNVES